MAVTSSALTKNNATSTLASSITNVVTSLTVAAGDGAKYPNPGAGEYFYCTLSNALGTTIEIVKVTARATDVFTVVRGQDGTTGQAFNAGDIVEMRPVSALFGEKLDAKALKYVSKTADYTVVAADLGYTIEANTNSITLSLTAAATLGEGFWFIAKNNNAAGANTLVVDPNASETVDGIATCTDYPGAVRLFYCDGANWRSHLIQGGTAQWATGGSFSFIMPNNAVELSVKLYGAGGGGGAGQSAATATARLGGTGGGGGSRQDRTFSPFDFGAYGSTSTIVVGTGGSGGTGTSGAAGSNGAGGGNTSINGSIVAYGGGGGKGGTSAIAAGGGTGAGTSGAGNTAPTAASAGGSPATATNAVGISGQGAGSTTNVNTSPNPAEWGGAAGGGVLTAGGAGGPGGRALYGGPGGGGGAGITTGNAAAAGGAGGAPNSWSTGGGGGGAGGTTAGTSGTAGTVTAGTSYAGSGGGGGGTNGTSTVGAGGAGARGAGGGGGAAALTGTAGGAGGKGGDGFAAIAYK